MADGSGIALQRLLVNQLREVHLGSWTVLRFRGLGFRGLGFRGLGFRGLGFRV